MSKQKVGHGSAQRLKAFQDGRAQGLAEAEARLAAAQIELDAREKDALGLMQMNNELTEKFAREKKIATELVNEKLELSTRLAAHEAQIVRDLESRLAAAERDGKEAVDELAGENTEHMNRIAALEIKLADAKAIAQSRSEALDEQEKRWGAKLRELQYNQPSGDGKGGEARGPTASRSLAGTSPTPAPETPEGKTFRDCDTCIKVECHLRGYRGTAVCRPLRK